MGFFSGIRRRIKKLIPKEVAPIVPFAAAYFGGPALAAKFSGLSPAMAKALVAGGTRFASDDEADIKSSLISINSPIARSLIGKEEGDTVIAETPSGGKEFEILKISYE